MDLQIDLTGLFRVKDCRDLTALILPQGYILFEVAIPQVQYAMPTPIVQAHHWPRIHMAVIQDGHLVEKIPDALIVVLALEGTWLQIGHPILLAQVWSLERTGILELLT